MSDREREIAAEIAAGTRPLPPGWHTTPYPHPAPPPPGWERIGFNDDGSPLHWRPERRLPPINWAALRRAFAGPDLPAKRRYLVIVDGAPHELREPDDRTPDPEDGGS